MPPPNPPSISRIASLREYGIFRDFSWPAGLADFGRYNSIYGWNWTGKTTLSRLFRDLELRRPPTMGEATLHIEGVDVHGKNFPQSTLQIRVFNRDFIHESVFPVGGGDVPPIFVVGKESVEKQKEADRLKAERGTKDAELNAARATKQQAERESLTSIPSTAPKLSRTLSDCRAARTTTTTRGTTRAGRTRWRLTGTPLHTF